MDVASLNFYLSITGLCKESDPSCEDCNTEDPAKCAKCHAGYYLDESMKCQGKIFRIWSSRSISNIRNTVVTILPMKFHQLSFHSREIHLTKGPFRNFDSFAPFGLPRTPKKFKNSVISP